MSEAKNQLTWRDVPQWSMGSNDILEDCSVAALANWIDLWSVLLGRSTAPIEPVECQRLFTLMTGWDQFHPANNHGVFLDAVIRYMVEHGWPADEVWQPAGFHEAAATQIPNVLLEYRVLPCWAMLPIEDGEPVFEDTDTPGMAPHAMLMVDYDGRDITLISWAEPVKVSWDWWVRNGRQIFAVELPAGFVVPETAS